MSLFEYQSKLYPHEKYQLYLAVLNLYGLEGVTASCAERLFKEQIIIKSASRLMRFIKTKLVDSCN